MPRKTEHTPAGATPRSDRLSAWFDLLCTAFEQQVATGIDVARDARHLTLLARASKSMDVARASERRALVDHVRAVRDIAKLTEDLAAQINPPINSKAEGDEMDLNDDPEDASDPERAERLCRILNERFERYAQRLEADGILEAVVALAAERDAALALLSPAAISMAA